MQMGRGFLFAHYLEFITAIKFVSNFGELAIFAAMNIKLRIILIAILFQVVCSVSAQQNQMQREQPLSQKESDGKDTIVFKMKVFRLVDNLARENVVKVDTTINDFQIYHPELKQSITVQSLGNLGCAYQSHDYFSRVETGDGFIFLQNYYDYGIWANQFKFYDVTKPYTLLEYGQWFNNRPNGETWLNVFHTQNINKNLNFGFFYNSIASQGQYLNQEAKVRNLGLFSRYNNDRYDYWLSLGTNKFDIEENGGLPQPSDIENPDLKPENLAVWMDGASNEIKNLSAVFSHQYKLGSWKEVQEKDEVFEQFIPRVAIQHIFEVSSSKRVFTEIDPNPYFNYTGSLGDVYYYGEGHVPYINGVVGTEESPATRDQSGMNRVSNRFYLKFVEAPDRKYTFGKNAFIGNDIVKVNFPRQALAQGDSVLGMTQKDDYSNTFIGGTIYRTEGKFWNWSGTGKYYIQGRNFSDFELSATIDKPIIIAKDTTLFKIYGEMANRTPNYFLDHYYSNHYKWENSFDRIYNLTLGASFDSPGLRLKAGANYRIVNNYVFMNEQILPEQASSEFSVFQAYIQKDFKAGGMNFKNKVQLQETTTERYLQVPQLVIYNSSFYEGVLSKVLFYQLGFDVRYETKYYADYYSPATGMFYLQKNEKIGNYPWIDAFLNLRIKRTRFYVKYSNMATLFMEGGYFTTPYYPAQIATASFGLSWSFYD